MELLKVLLRMTSERHAVASKVIATVDDLEQIAADDNAEVAALHGWRRELFGEAALSLKHGRLALAIEKGRVVRVIETSGNALSRRVVFLVLLFVRGGFQGFRHLHQDHRENIGAGRQI